MAGRFRSLGRAVFGLVGTSTVFQQVGVNIDPIAFAPVEDIVLDFITLPAGNAFNSSIHATFADHMPSFVKTMLRSSIIGYLYDPLLSIIFCQLFLALLSYLVERRAPTVGDTVTQVPPQANTETSRAQERSVTIAHKKASFLASLKEFCVDRSSVMVWSRQRYDGVIKRLHHQHMNLIKTMENKFMEVIVQMWQGTQEKDRQIVVLTANASEQKAINTATSEQLETETSRNKRLEEDLRKAKQERDESLVTAEQLQDTNKNLADKCRGQEQHVQSLQDKVSNLSSQVQAKDKMNHQLQDTVKDMEIRETKHRGERESLAAMNSSLRSENQRLTAQNFALESERAKLSEENSALRTQNSQQTKSIEKDEKPDHAISEHDLPSNEPRQQNLTSDSVSELQLPRAGSRTDASSTTSNGKRSSRLATSVEIQDGPAGRKVVFTGASSGQVEHKSTGPAHTPASGMSKSTGSKQYPPIGNTQKDSVAAWQTFGKTVAQDEERKRQERAAQYAARLQEEERTGVRQTPTLQPIQETWRQVTFGDNDQRQVANTIKRTVGLDKPAEQPSGAFSFTQAAPSTSGGHLDWNHPPSPVTNRETDLKLDLGEDKPRPRTVQEVYEADRVWLPPHLRPRPAESESPPLAHPPPAHPPPAHSPPAQPQNEQTMSTASSTPPVIPATGAPANATSEVSLSYQEKQKKRRTARRWKKKMEAKQAESNALAASGSNSAL
ncbi:MAG: hypothetical protein LQ338_003542 [Usnochroma carphineum]|nr:MAG: hypothetical protein LQ338_003542 [Usnochroma carphineum]